MSSSSSSSSEEGSTKGHDSSGEESGSEDEKSDSPDEASDDGYEVKDSKSDTGATSNARQNQSLVDLDALEEEVVKLEEKMLPFSIFTKRKALDPLHDNLFADSELEISHPIASLNDEMQDTDSHLDSLHENFAAIGAQLTDEAHHEKVVKQFEDEDGNNSDGVDDDDGANEKDESKNGRDDEDGDDAEGTPKNEDDIQESLAKMVLAHKGEDALESEKGNNSDDDSEKEEEDAIPAKLPDFSNFKTEVERTLQKKSKRVAGQSQLEQIMGGDMARNGSPRKGGMKRSRTMPSRPGEESYFFDWKKHATAVNIAPQREQKNPEHTATNANANEEKADAASFDRVVQEPERHGVRNTDQRDIIARDAPTNEEPHSEVTGKLSKGNNGDNVLQPIDSPGSGVAEDELAIDNGAALGGTILGGTMSGTTPSHASNKAAELNLDYGTYKSEARRKLDETDGDDPTRNSSVLKILEDKRENPPLTGNSNLTLDYDTYTSEAKKAFDDESDDDLSGASSALQILRDKEEVVSNEVVISSLLLGGGTEKDLIRGKNMRKKKRKGGVTRSITAPAGSMRRPGEAFFDWKKFADNNGQENAENG